MKEKNIKLNCIKQILFFNNNHNNIIINNLNK